MDSTSGGLAFLIKNSIFGLENTLLYCRSHLPLCWAIRRDTPAYTTELWAMVLQVLSCQWWYFSIDS